jgi:endonuclease YncB( thermonuclease family)
VAQYASVRQAVALIAALLCRPAMAQETPLTPSTGKTIRDVTPPGVIRVFRGQAEAAAPRRATSITIDRPLVKPDGLIAGDEISLRLDGVAFPAAKRICIDNTGESWPRGRRTFISLYNKIKDDRIDCEPKSNDKPPLADCFVGDLNLAEWLLRDGLVTRSAGNADPLLAAAENAAK